MTTTTRDLGDKCRLTCTFKNLAGADTDPTAISFKMMVPDGTVTAYVFGVDAELVKSATGIYYVDWITDQAGRHLYRFIGTGTVAQTVEGELYVLRDGTNVAPTGV